MGSPCDDPLAISLPADAATERVVDEVVDDCDVVFASVACAVQLLLPLACAELVYTVNENAAQSGGGMVATEDHMRDQTSTTTRFLHKKIYCRST